MRFSTTNDSLCSSFEHVHFEQRLHPGGTRRVERVRVGLQHELAEIGTSR